MPATSETNAEVVAQVRHIVSGYSDMTSWFGKPSLIPADEYIIRETSFASKIPGVDSKSLLVPAILFLPRTLFQVRLPESACNEENQALADEIMYLHNSYNHIYSQNDTTQAIPHSLMYFSGWGLYAHEMYLRLINRTRMLASIVFGMRYSAYILAHGDDLQVEDTGNINSATYRNLMTANLIFWDLLDNDVDRKRITEESANKLIEELDKGIRIGNTSVSIGSVLENLRNGD